MARIITITSGKGGVGKTTVTSNLGVSLALLGQKVCLVDADFGLRNLDIALGLTNRVLYDISDFINGKCSLNQVVIKHKSLSNLTLLPGSKLYSHTSLEPRKFTEMINSISEAYDYVLIDSPAGIEIGFKTAVEAADEVIVLTNTTAVSVQDADRVLGLLEEMNIRNEKLIINMDYTIKNKKLGLLDNEQIIDRLHVPCLGTITNDLMIIQSNHKGTPIAFDPTNENSIRFRQIARNLHKHELKPFVSLNPTKNKKRFLPHLPFNNRAVSRF